MPIILGGKLRQGVCNKFKASLIWVSQGYIVKPYLQREREEEERKEGKRKKEGGTLELLVPCFSLEI